MEDTSTAPIPVVYEPWRYFYRIYGTIREVHPLTYPNRENDATQLVEVLNTGQIIRVDSEDLIIYR